MNKRLRNLIIESFKQPETHPKAEDIFEVVKKQFNDLDLQIFLAELTDLEKQGQIRSINHIDNQKHYHSRQDQHFHFICEKCGQVKDVVMENGATKMIKDHAQVLCSSFARVDKVNMSFQGLCHECFGK